MKVTYNWIKEFVPINASPVDVAKKLTSAGMEVEEIIYQNEHLHDVVVGKILKIEKHPAADKLVVCQVDIGTKIVQILTAATNVFEGALVPVSLPGADLVNGVKIQPTKMRGVESYGMFCSGQELGIDENYFEGAGVDGILILPNDMKIGEPIDKALSLDDVVFDVNITPNRADCMSVVGIAREVCAIYGVEMRKINLNYSINVYDKDTEKQKEMCDMNIIQTRNLTKSYNDFTAVSNLNLHVPKGSVYGFVGPNGAGKSTTMKMFLGLTRPSSGAFVIDKMSYPHNRVKILREIGSFIEAPAFYGNLTGEENLDIIRRILKLPKSTVDDALELVDLTPYKKRLARKYSLGMKQRLGLAGALLGRPPILILDEPTNGLDPVGIHEIRTLIRSLPDKFDCTVFVSSHLLSEIELMADHIGVLNHGHLLFEGTLEELKEKAAFEGYPDDNLEDMFLALFEEDNLRRGDAK